MNTNTNQNSDVCNKFGECTNVSIIKIDNVNKHVKKFAPKEGHIVVILHLHIDNGLGSSKEDKTYIKVLAEKKIDEIKNNI